MPPEKRFRPSAARLRFLSGCILALTTAPANHAASASPTSELDTALVLIEKKQFTEARSILEKLALAEPKNVVVCYHLGHVLAKNGDAKSDDAAATWLGRAAELDPKNATYSEEYGLAQLQVASRTRSPFTAIKGRDALEKAVTLDPGRLSVHEMLFSFYQAAPWPIGGSSKATAHLDEIRRRDPGRGVEIELLLHRPEARAHLSDAAIAQAATTEAQRQLRILRAASFEPIPPVSLANITTDRAVLSDVIWTSATVGWGQPARNHYFFDEKFQNCVFLKLGGKIFEKGLYAHAPSRYVFALDGRWKTLTATIGLRDGALSEGSAVFTVRGDGRELYRSPILRAGTSTPIELDVSGVTELELFAAGGEGHNHHAWSIWVDPLLRRDVP